MRCNLSCSRLFEDSFLINLVIFVAGQAAAYGYLRTGRRNRGVMLMIVAWVLIDVINRRSFGWSMDISISPDILLSALALSVGAALIAGIYPAYRAARAQPALAMREE